jgi:hypothetical protein
MPTCTGCAILTQLEARLRDSVTEHGRCTSELYKFVGTAMFGASFGKCKQAHRRYLELKEAVREHGETHRCSDSWLSHLASRAVPVDEKKP